MKQLLSLFLFLLPCLAWAQYPSNGNQKITLGEQTTADGLIFRGVASTDTVRKPSIDTMAYMVLDTTTNIIWHYKKATSNAWLRLNLLPSDTASIAYVNTYGTQTINGAKTFTTAPTFSTALGVASGGTGASSFSPNNYLIRTNSSGIFDTAAIYETGGNVGIGKISSIDFKLDVSGNQSRFLSTQSTPLLIDRSTGNGCYIGLRDGSTKLSYFGNSDGNFVLQTPGSAYAIKFTVLDGGNIGIGQTTPTAVLHLKAGTTSASSAPLKFTSGTNLTTAEAGAMEFNGTNLFFSPSTVRHTVNHGLTGSATLDFPSTLTLLSADLTITVTGAADGDVVSLGVPNAAVNANTSYSAWVSASNTVTVRFNNYSNGTVNPASGSFKVFVTK
jgi:hypothetical protein